MFNTTNNHTHVKSGPSHVDVHEHRAPTDASVKLLKEMEKKAKDKIILSQHLDSNYVKALIIAYADDIVHDRVNYHIRFKLNDKEFHLQKDFDNWDIATHRDALMFLYAEFSKIIAEGLIKSSPDFLNKIRPQLKSIKDDTETD